MFLANEKIQKKFLNFGKILENKQNFKKIFRKIKKMFLEMGENK